MGLVKTVWITRTEPGANESARAWQEAGFKPVIAPLLEVSAPNQKPVEPISDSLLVFTSPNGVFAYQSYAFNLNHPVITVGEKTASVARSAGFKDVISANGTSEDVTALILRTISKTMPIAHCAGKHVRGSIIEDLREAGYDARRYLYYESAPVKTMPLNSLSDIDIIALYSPLAASTLEGFEPELTGKTIISISAATDAELGAVDAKRLVAKTPDQAAMIALLLP